MWLAQREDLPDTHKHWADPGSELERVFVRIGYVEVPAPGSDQHDEPAPKVDVVELEDQDVEDEPEEDAPALREE